MKHLIFLLFLTTLLSSNANAENNKPTAEETAKTILTSIYMNDPEGFQRDILPEPDYEVLIGKNNLTEEEKQKTINEIKDLKLLVHTDYHLGNERIKPKKNSFPEGTKITFFTQYRYTNLVIPVVYTANGWKVEARYWIETYKRSKSRLAKDDPKVFAKLMLIAIMAKKPKIIDEISVEPGVGEKLIKANDLPGGDLDHILALCTEMPTAIARDGEVIALPNGKTVVAPASQGELYILGMMGSIEVAFHLKQVDGVWKVQPYDYVQYLRKAKAV